MSHYEERLEQDLSHIRQRVSDMIEAIDVAIDQSTRALLDGEPELASRTIIEDYPINGLSKEIDGLCHGFIVRHLPSAGVLRFISSVLRLNVAFERIGDYACSISREALLISKHPPKTLAKDIAMMAGASRQNLRDATRVFIEGQSEEARTVLHASHESRREFSKLYAHLLKAGAKQSRPPQDLFAILITFYRLERINDQARNICEETLFAVDGEIKEPKRHRVLFIDERDGYLAPLAAALAAKAYPELGSYASAGWTPGPGLDPAAKAYMEDHGLDSAPFGSQAVPRDHDGLLDYDLIICLEGEARETLEDLPFRTVLLNWKLGSLTENAPLDHDRLEEIHKELIAELHDLMKLLSGTAL